MWLALNELVQLVECCMYIVHVEVLWVANLNYGKQAFVESLEYLG